MLRISILVGVFSLAATSAFGQTITEIGDDVMAEYVKQTDASARLAQVDDPEFPLVRGSAIYEYKTLSSGKAFLYSLILPGAGQLYTGSKIKAGVFFALEASAWLGRFHHRGVGHDQVAEYEAFANAHWSDVSYFDSLGNQYNPAIDRWDDGNQQWAHHLPFQVIGTDTTALMNHEYYENIGKYQQFVWGWDDLAQVSTTAAEPENNYESQGRRAAYLVMREDANIAFDRARKVSILIIGNHLLSAFEAALSARSHNRSSEHARKLDVSVQMVQLDQAPTPWVSVAYRF